MGTSWRATCIQMPTEVAWPLLNREAAASRLEHNMDVALQMLDRAFDADPPPSLLLLPEYAFTGQPNLEPVASWIDKVCHPIPGPLTEPLQAVARERGVYIGGNQFERDPEWGDRLFNTSWLSAPNGEIILRYRRVHTALWCSPHDILDQYVARYGWEGIWPVVDTPLGRIGMIPCGEIAVPEASRTMALRGCEVLLHPTWEPPTPVQDAAKTLAAAANVMYVISANIAGAYDQGRVENAPRVEDLGKGSRVINHRGETVAAAPPGVSTALVSGMVDLDELREARRGLSGGNRLAQLRVEAVAPAYATSIYPPNSFADAPLEDWREVQAPREAAVDAVSGQPHGEAAA